MHFTTKARRETRLDAQQMYTRNGQRKTVTRQGNSITRGHGRHHTLQFKDRVKNVFSCVVCASSGALPGVPAPRRSVAARGPGGRVILLAYWSFVVLATRT